MKLPLTMSFSFLLLAACPLLSPAGETPSDVQLRKHIVGTWSSDRSSALTVFSNGTFVSGYTNIHSSPRYGWNYEGRWALTNSIFMLSVTNTRAWGITNEPRHLTIERWKILRLDDREYVSESGGITNVMVRQK